MPMSVPLSRTPRTASSSSVLLQQVGQPVQHRLARGRRAMRDQRPSSKAAAGRGAGAGDIRSRSLPPRAWSVALPVDRATGPATCFARLAVLTHCPVDQTAGRGVTGWPRPAGRWWFGQVVIDLPVLARFAPAPSTPRGSVKKISSRHGRDHRRPPKSGGSRRWSGRHWTRRPPGGSGFRQDRPHDDAQQGSGSGASGG